MHLKNCYVCMPLQNWYVCMPSNYYFVGMSSSDLYVVMPLQSSVCMASNRLIRVHSFKLVTIVNSKRNSTLLLFSISSVNVNVFWLKFHMSITWPLEYTVHSCQVDLQQAYWQVTCSSVIMWLVPFCTALEPVESM